MIIGIFPITIYPTKGIKILCRFRFRLVLSRFMGWVFRYLFIPVCDGGYRRGPPVSWSEWWTGVGEKGTFLFLFPTTTEIPLPFQDHVQWQTKGLVHPQPPEGSLSDPLWSYGRSSSLLVERGSDWRPTRLLKCQRAREGPTVTSSCLVQSLIPLEP